MGGRRSRDVFDSNGCSEGVASSPTTPENHTKTEYKVYAMFSFAPNPPFPPHA